MKVFTATLLLAISSPALAQSNCESLNQEISIIRSRVVEFEDFDKQKEALDREYDNKRANCSSDSGCHERASDWYDQELRRLTQDYQFDKAEQDYLKDVLKNLEEFRRQEGC